MIQLANQPPAKRPRGRKRDKFAEDFDRPSFFVFDNEQEELAAPLVYDAEWFMDENYRGARLPTMEDVRRRLDQIMATRWFQMRYPRVEYIRLKDGRGARRCSGMAGTDRDGNYFISLLRSGRCELFLLHELAHVVGAMDHGPYFCCEYLALVRRFIGVESANELRYNFILSGVKHRKPRIDQSWAERMMFPEIGF